MSDPMPSMKRCPDCLGSRLEQNPLRACSRCNGTGVITSEQAKLIAEGRALQADREARGLTEQAEAARRRLPLWSYTAMERGREACPAEAL